MANRIVFIGGVHGVGKTYFCKKLADQFDTEHVTASSLIMRHVKKFKNKTVPDVEKNQLILAEELSLYKTDRRTILLDGHFCLLSSTSDIKDVPLSTFEAISPYAIILLKDNPSSIVTRLSQRDGQAYNLNLVSALQDREHERANLVSEALKVSIKVIEPMIDIEKSIREVSKYL
ncbi:MAG TPA: AAA family ATPase [bacterium]|nr:AAA family ATPase [bacterium]